MPNWMGSIRVRLTVIYSSVLFSVASVVVGIVYIGESQSLARSEVAEPTQFVRLGPSFVGQIIDANDFRNAVDANTLEVLRRFSLIAIVVFFLISLIVGWFVSGSVLKPIGRITEVAKDIQATDLSRRINLGGPQDELRELADTFDDMLGRLDDAFESQREFIHEASHELRNPLAVIRTNLDVTLADPGATDEDLRHTLAVVQRSSERMTRLVDDLLVYARKGSLSVEREVLDASTLVRDAADEFRAPAEAKGITLVDHSPPGLWVEGDRNALRQAMANLLANAVRLSPAGTTIRVRGGAEAPWVWLSVEDEGPGIAAEDQERVFQRFFRTKPDEARREGRSGLGLTIVRQVAEAHGGEVKLVSEPGRGSAFAIWLPAAEHPTALPT
jgi:signal transduction histidine kinase